MADMRPRRGHGGDRDCTESQWDGSHDGGLDLVVLLLAQASKQVRAELLPRWYRTLELAFEV